MKLILARDDGEVVESWDVEVDFGDLDQNLPRLLMAAEITLAWRRWKNDARTTADDAAEAGEGG